MAKKESWMLVTPELARQWLLLNNSNRTLQRKRVEDYAREMKAGRWYVTHQGVAFYDDGSLCDGQHRLAAIVMSGCTQEMRVTWGIQRVEGRGIDLVNQRDSRSQLEIEKQITVPFRAADIARNLPALVYEMGSPRRLSVHELETYLAKYASGIAMTIRVFSSHVRGLSSVAVRSAFAYAYPTNRERVEEIASSFVAGEGLRPGSQLIKLRDRAIRLGDMYQAERRSFFAQLCAGISSELDGKRVRPSGAASILRFAYAYGDQDRLLERIRSEDEKKHGGQRE